MKNGETITLKFDDDTKIAAGYILQEEDVVEVTYGSTSLVLKEIKLLDRKVEPEEDAAPDDSGEADDGDSGGTAPEGEGAEGEGAEGARWWGIPGRPAPGSPHPSVSREPAS